ISRRLWAAMPSARPSGRISASQSLSVQREAHSAPTSVPWASAASVRARVCTSARCRSSKLWADRDMLPRHYALRPPRPRRTCPPARRAAVSRHESGPQRSPLHRSRPAAAGCTHQRAALAGAAAHRRKPRPAQPAGPPRQRACRTASEKRTGARQRRGHDRPPAYARERHMSRAPAEPVSIRSLDKEYLIACPPDERADLLRAATLLETRLKTARESARGMGIERWLIMAGLDLANQL